MSKKIIHFVHANSFPAKTYNKLFSYLREDFKIGYLERHAHNPKFPVTDGWDFLKEELREEIEKRYAEKIIGVGHSFGGILHFLAAIKNPDLYKAIVLLDAPIISRLSSAGIKFLKKVNLIEKFSPFRVTRFRRSVWHTKKEAFEHFRRREKFQKFDETVLRDYVQHGTIESENKVKLFFEPNIEAEIYRTIPHNLPQFRGKLKIPAFYIGGKNSREAHLARIGFMQKHFPFQFHFIEGSHLFPLEKPQETAGIIQQILSSKIL